MILISGEINLFIKFGFRIMWRIMLISGAVIHILFDLHNFSHHTQPHWIFVNCKIVMHLFIIIIVYNMRNDNNNNNYYYYYYISKFYKITKIVWALWLAERSVCMRVYKHGCGVKMFCFSRANQASTNLEKFSSSKLDKFTLFTYSFVGWNLENRYREVC